MNDTVNHPAHYTDGKYEVIDMIEQQNLDFCLGNAVKYICRAGKKDPDKTVEDLQKAKWYLKRKYDQTPLMVTHCSNANADFLKKDFHIPTIPVMPIPEKGCISPVDFIEDKGLSYHSGMALIAILDRDLERAILELNEEIKGGISE